MELAVPKVLMRAVRRLAFGNLRLGFHYSGQRCANTI